MNHRDTTIVMFFLLGGLILALLVLALLCCTVFVRARRESRSRVPLTTHSEKYMKQKSIQ